MCIHVDEFYDKDIKAQWVNINYFTDVQIKASTSTKKLNGYLKNNLKVEKIFIFSS